MGELRGQNDVVLEGSQVTSSPYNCLSTVDCEVWDRAEAAAEEVIRKVQPSVVSEERRRDVIDYLKSLLKGYLGCEVLPFGSVPLKAYLPDGDIDLTVFCGFNFEEAFAEEVYAVLEAEERNPAAKFVVKDVQYIRAEVKLVKCLVENVVVDVSFNQIGGLCALCFLEEMDRLIGKDHLFKRSIILIKAWCYYESRILGAHHGLISTYALETLVLYIFHVFHSTLDGPLAVLHKFLEYFSEFNWDNFWVNLNGPVHGASPPEALADKPETSGRELLLSDDFMKEYVRKFSVPFRGADTNYKSFTQKYLNIVDPLKENNNLGRSVSKGNFFRIRTAFLFGAEKLGQILLQPQEKIAVEVRKFFTNTLDRHGKGNRPDVQKHLQLSSSNGYISETPPPFAEPYQDQFCTREEDSIYSNNKSSESRVGFDGMNNSSTQTLSGVVLCKELSKDTNKLETSGNRDLRTTEQGDKCCPSIGEKEKLRYAPHLYFQHSLEKGKMENECLDEEQDIESSLLDNNLVCAPTHQEINGFLCHDSLSRGTERHDVINQLPDLSGDLGCHLDNLQHGRWWYSHGLAMPMHPMHRVPLSMFIPNVSWDGMHPTVLSRQEMVPQVNVNGAILRPPFFPRNPPAASLGSGAHFTIENDLSFRDRSAPKRRNRGQLKSSCVNGRGRTPLDRSPQAQVPFHRNIGRPIFPNNHERSPRGKVYRETNGFLQPPTNVIAYCDPMNLPTETENFKPRESDPSSESQNIERVFGVNVNNSRYSIQPYRVKNEDFHRLCV